MPTAYPATVRTDLAADKAFKTTQAQALVDRGKVLVQYPFALDFAEGSWTGTAAHSIFNWDLPVHSAIAGKTIVIYVDAKVTGGTGHVDLLIGGTGTTQVEVTATDYTKTGPVTYTLPSSGTYDDFTAVNLSVCGLVTAGNTIYLRGSKYLWCWFTD